MLVKDLIKQLVEADMDAEVEVVLYTTHEDDDPVVRVHPVSCLIMSGHPVQMYTLPVLSELGLDLG
jgi:hypothetical protein